MEEFKHVLQSETFKNNFEISGNWFGLKKLDKKEIFTMINSFYSA